jgi:hypothetical protein
MTNLSQKTSKSWQKKIIPVFIVAWFSMIGIGVFGLTSLMNPGEINSRNRSLNESVSNVSELPPELDFSDLTEDTEKPTLSFFTLIILLLTCSGGSLLITYLLRFLVTSKPKKTPLKSKKNAQNIPISPPRNKAKNKPPQQPIVTVISSEEATPLDQKKLSLAEMMDLRKRRSIMSIMHDN